MTKIFCTFVFLLMAGAVVAQADEWVGKTSDFHSFKQHDFAVDDLQCRIVVPDEEAEGRPWVWRARFFGHEPQADIALLGQGFHIAYVDVADLFGSPKAVARWDAFYEFLTTQKGFSKKPALEGMSRGGLIVYNWASQNPEKVACIYADAPVCDFKSWPGGKGVGIGAPRAWKQCLEAYGLTEPEAMAYTKNPVDTLEPLVAAGVPLLHVVGDADNVVPVSENTDVMKARYEALGGWELGGWELGGSKLGRSELGGSMTVIRKPGVGHHPHSLKDPAPIVDFILKYATASPQPIRLACVGDSITFGARIKDRDRNSYPAQLATMLGKEYQVENFGVSGATLLKKGNRPYWQTHRFKPAHDFGPDIVVIKLGTNDSKPENWQYKDDYVADYVALIKSFRSLPEKPEVWICYPVPAFPGNGNITDKVMREEVIPLIDQVAKQTQVEIIDLYSALKGKKHLFPDTIHPNAEGAKIMAETICPIISQ